MGGTWSVDLELEKLLVGWDDGGGQHEVDEANARRAGQVGLLEVVQHLASVVQLEPPPPLRRELVGAQLHQPTLQLEIGFFVCVLHTTTPTHYQRERVKWVPTGGWVRSLAAEAARSSEEEANILQSQEA